MKVASRFMPTATTRSIQPIGVIFLVILGATLIYAVIRQPFVVASVTIVLVVATLALNMKWRRRLHVLATQRGGDSICSFARDFEFRQTDTWVIRAVYEEIQDYLKSLHHAFPVRASDRLTADLGIDPDDLDFDIAPRVAQRTGRSIDDTQRNPHYGQVHTAGDMVRFFCVQPREVQPNISLERTRVG